MSASPLIVDANSVIMRAVFASALDDLQAGGKFTGGIYGSLSMLRSVIDHPEADFGAIVAFFDSGVPAKRLQLLPGYKQARRERKEILDEEQKEKAYAQLGVCRKLWPLLGIQCLAYKNREADDGVAAAAQVYLKQGHRPVILSSDKDLWQTVRWGARIWKMSDGGMIDADNFCDHSGGVTPETWLLYRALTGDSSDSIQGVPGCGPKRAVKLLSDFPVEPLAQPLDQLAELASSVRTEAGTRKLRAYESSLLEHERRLQDVLKGIDLSKSFGKLTGLRRRLKEMPTLQPRPFLKFCKGLEFASVLGDPERTLAPFRLAEARR